MGIYRYMVTMVINLHLLTSDNEILANSLLTYTVSPLSLLKDRYDLVFWTSYDGILKSQILTSETIAINPSYSIKQLADRMNPILNIFLPKNFKHLSSYLSQANHFFSQHWTDLSNIYLKVLQNIFLFVLPPDADLKLVENQLMVSNLTNFHINSNCFALALSKSNRSSYITSDIFHLYEFYYLKNVFKLNLVGIDRWEKLQQVLLHPVSHRRRNFELVEILAVGYCNDHHPEECKWNNKTESFESGGAVNVYRDLQMALNFSEKALNIDSYVSAREANETLLKQKDLPNNLTVAGLLLLGKMDVATSTNIYTVKLSPYFSLPHPTFRFGLMAFFKQPRYTKISIFISPFRSYIWQACFYFWLVIACVAASFVVAERFYLRRESGPIIVALFEITSDVIYSSIACLCQRGLESIPFLFKSRYIFTTALFASILWNAAYQAGYLATLSVFHKSIRQFQQILDDDYLLGVNSASVSIPFYVKTMLDTKNISDSRMKFVSNSEALEFLSKKKFAYLTYFGTFHAMLHESNSLRTANPDGYFCQALSALKVDQKLPTSGFVLPKHSPFREHFNIEILHLKEFGLNYKYVKTYERNTQPRCLPVHKRWSHFDLKDVELAFHVLFFGSAFSLAFLSLQIIVRCKLKPRQVKTGDVILHSHSCGGGNALKISKR